MSNQLPKHHSQLHCSSTRHQPQLSQMYKLLLHLLLGMEDCELMCDFQRWLGCLSVYWRSFSAATKSYPLQYEHLSDMWLCSLKISEAQLYSVAQNWSHAEITVLMCETEIVSAMNFVPAPKLLPIGTMSPKENSGEKPCFSNISAFFLPTCMSNKYILFN